METEFDPDLPEDAKKLIVEAEESVARIQKKAEREIAAIESEVEEKITELREKAKPKIDKKSVQAEKDIKAEIDKLLAELGPLQESFAKKGKLNEALAIRDQVHRLRTGSVGEVLPYQGDLSAFVHQVGKTFRFEVVGSNHGALWGTDTYTGDSDLAAAAVHAGAVISGKKGVVKVKIVDTTSMGSFEGSERNGVASGGWGPYPTGYQVSRG
jgi:hypothetical protein